MALVRDALSILSLALCQAADLRGVGEGRERLGEVTSRLYRGVRAVVPRLDNDRAMEGDIVAVSARLAARSIDLGATLQ